jgi:hypothetical protein
MQRKSVILLFLAIITIATVVRTQTATPKVEAPTIGILSGNDERWYFLQRFWRMSFWSYVARSYVNMLE